MNMHMEEEECRAKLRKSILQYVYLCMLSGERRNSNLGPAIAHYRAQAMLLGTQLESARQVSEALSVIDAVIIYHSKKALARYNRLIEALTNNT